MAGFSEEAQRSVGAQVLYPARMGQSNTPTLLR
jgi:hypothetical protein